MVDFMISEHARRRMQQRGRRLFEVSFVLEHGTQTKDGILFTDDDARRVEAHAKRVIELARRLGGVFLPCDGATVRTIFNSSRSQQRRQLYPP